MKKLILSIALGVLVSGGATAYAHDSQSEVRRVAYTEHHRDSLDREIHHLNRMLAHVRRHVRHYRGGERVRREIDQISRDVERVNYRFNRGSFNRWGLRREVDRLHDRLHAIETRMHFRSRDIYHWD